MKNIQKKLLVGMAIFLFGLAFLLTLKPIGLAVETQTPSSVIIAGPPGTPEEPGGDGGGGGGGGATTDSEKDFLVSKDLVTADVVQGELFMATIRIINPESSSQSFSLNVDPSLSEFVSLFTDNFVLQAGEERTINLIFSSSLDSTPFVHTGHLNITGEDKEKSVPIIFIINQKKYSFLVDKLNMEIELIQGDSTTEYLLITNNENISQSFDLDFSFDLKEFLSLSKNSFTLEAGESENISLDFATDSNSIPLVYTGGLIITNGEIEKEVSIVFTVEELPRVSEEGEDFSSKEKERLLFDVFLEIDEEYKEISPGEELVLNITLINLGNTEDVRIPVTYFVKNFRNNVIISEEAIRDVSEKEIFSKKIKLPLSFNEGSYAAAVQIEFGGLIASASDVFIVKKSEYALLEFAYENGEIILVNRSLEIGKSPTISHDSEKEYKVVLFASNGEILQSTSFDNPSNLFADAFEGDKIDGEVMTLGDIRFYLNVPDSKESNKIEIFKQELKVIKEDVYDVGAQSCRIK